jgi:hypothetical protein
MSTAFPSELVPRQLDSNHVLVYCCAALTGPSELTGHMQTNDILVSINDISLISDSKQAGMKGGPEAFFDLITSAIKHATFPKRVRLLRPFRAQGESPPSIPTVFDVHLNSSEISCLFDKNQKTHVPKFTVGKVPFGKSFESSEGSLFDVIFPNQTSLGIRIFPYRLIDSLTNAQQFSSAVSDEVKNSYEDDDIEDHDDELSQAQFALRLFENVSNDNGDGLSSESDVMANINDFLSRLETEKCFDNSPSRSDRFQQSKLELNRRWSADCGGVPRSDVRPPRIYPKGNFTDDDIVSDVGDLSVGAHVSRLEAVADDYIPVYSGNVTNGDGHIESMYEDDEMGTYVVRKGPLAVVEDIVALYESTSRKTTPTRNSCAANRSPSQKFRLDDFGAATPKGVRSVRKSLPPRMTPSRDNTDRRASSFQSDSPTRRRGISPVGRVEYDLEELAREGGHNIAAEKAQQEMRKLMKENENLRAKMGFMQCSVSIEKQLLNYELKGAKARLELSERELEESKIESKMNDIIMQDHLDNSIKDVVAVILLEKEEMVEKLRKARQDIVTIEVGFNDKLGTLLKQNEAIKAEITSKTDECALLTSDILNLQAERDCMTSSTVMTDFRTRSNTKSQTKELSRLKETESNMKAQIYTFITDFDKTILPTANPDDVIDQFLGGRGLAINRNRRRHFAALKADNTRLYDDLDTMQELLEVEAALQFTRVELYTKSVVVLQKPAETSAETSVPNAASNSAPCTPVKPSVKLLLNEVSPRKPTCRKSLDAPRSKKIDTRVPRRLSLGAPPRGTQSIHIHSDKDNIPSISGENPKSKEKERALKQKKILELSDCKENEKSPPPGGSNLPAPQSTEMEKGKSKIKFLESSIRENSAAFGISPDKLIDSPSSIVPSPLIAITPRKKNNLVSPVTTSSPPVRAHMAFTSSTAKGPQCAFKGTKTPQSSPPTVAAATVSDEFLASYPVAE